MTKALFFDLPVVKSGKPAYEKIKSTFGEEVLLSTGEINREKLGQIIFNDGGKRKLLNAIVHPAIKREMLWQVFWNLLKGQIKCLSQFLKNLLFPFIILLLIIQPMFFVLLVLVF